MFNRNFRRERNGSETIFKKIINENFSESVKNNNLQIQETPCILTSVNRKKSTTSILLKFQ